MGAVDEDAEPRHRGEGRVVDQRLAIDALGSRLERLERLDCDDRIAKLPLLAENVLAALPEKERAARRGIRDLGIELAADLALSGGHVVGALH